MPIDEGKPMDINNPTGDVTVSEQEMIDLGKFLENLRILLLNHEARLGVIENVVAQHLGINEQVEDAAVVDAEDEREPTDAELKAIEAELEDPGN